MERIQGLLDRISLVPLSKRAEAALDLDQVGPGAVQTLGRRPPAEDVVRLELGQELAESLAWRRVIASQLAFLNEPGWKVDNRCHPLRPLRRDGHRGQYPGIGSAHFLRTSFAGANNMGWMPGPSRRPRSGSFMPTARITIRLKPTVLDAQGAVVKTALHSLGFAGVQDVHMGKYVELELAEGSTSEQVEAMCRQLLANPIIEQFHVDLAAEA